MKKFATILVLLFVLSVSAFADGQYPIGGIVCPQGQTCFANGEFPIGNKTCPEGQTCLADGDILIGNKTDGQIPIGGLMEDSIIGNVFYHLKSIF